MYSFKIYKKIKWNQVTIFSSSSSSSSESELKTYS